MKIVSKIKTQSSQYKTNYSYNQEQCLALSKVEAWAEAGGSAKYHKQQEEQGKLAARKE